MEDREVLIKESVLEDIGEAIQEKTKSSKKFLPNQLGSTIQSLPTPTLTMNTGYAGIFKLELSVNMEVQ